MVRLHPWHRAFPPHVIGGSLYAVPPALRPRAAAQLDAEHCRVHIDVILGPDGHRGVAPEEIDAIAAAVPQGRLDLHLILVDQPPQGIAEAVTREVDRMLAIAERLSVAGVTLPTRLASVHGAAVERLRAGGVPVFLEVGPRDDVFGEDGGFATDAPVVDGCLVMLIEPGTRGQADPGLIDRVGRLAPTTPVAVDGGVTAELARACVAAGAHYVVSGRALFDLGDRDEAVATPDVRSEPEAPGATASSPLPSWQRVGDEITAVLDRVDPAVMTAAGRYLAQPSGRWFFTGQGRSGLVARMAAMRFMHLGRTAHVIGEATAPSVAEGDHVVALSKTGTTPVTLHLAQGARRAGADVLAVTADPASPLADLATAVLAVPDPGSAQFAGSLFEQTALLLLDSLVLDLGGADSDVQAAMHRRHANLQ